MATSVFSYPGENAEEVEAHLLEELKEQPQGQPLTPIPTPDQLRSLLDTTFFSSLLEEEGRQIRFALAIVSRTHAPHSGRIEFDSPVPLTLESIRKLALATDYETTHIAADWHNGSWHIWGLIGFGDPMYPDRNFYTPRHLAITVNKRGAFEIRLLGRRVASYSDGTRTLWSKLSTLNEHRLNTFLSAVLPPTEPFDRYLVAGLLYSIALAMQEAHKGGTLLIVPPDEGKAKGLTYNYSLLKQGQSILRERVHNSLLHRNEAQEANELNPATLIVQKQLSDALKFIKKLTEVDGAVVMTSTLELLGFGAMIDTGGIDVGATALCKVQENLAPGNDDLPLSFFKGSRHRSAARFCQLNPDGAVALVASQDGRLSLFARAKYFSKVQVMSPFELTIT